MSHQVPLDPGAAIVAAGTGSVEVAAPDIAWQRLGIVNVAFLGAPAAGDRGWVLVDAGLRGTDRLIRRAAAERFGEDARPAAILVTHAHFDHVGGLAALIDAWDVDAYAHPLEHPHLDGSSDYPAPAAGAGGGLISWLSPLFPRGAVDIRPRLKPLPADGSVPILAGWTWLHTPGHTEGHVSFWRESDRALVAGDAFITTAQEYALSAAAQSPEIHGPPAYFTSDWDAARRSVETLATLGPELAVTGHGPVVRGAALRDGLSVLARDFERIARPAAG